MSDLQNDPVVMLQKSADPFWNLLWCMHGAPSRTTLRSRTTENGWVSLFAIGEGWHNWHHAFPYDYAAAELGALSQFNPTKVFIDVMAWLGLAWDRKSALGAWGQRKERWEVSQGRPVLESTEGPPLFKKRVITFGPPPYGDDADQLDAPE